MPWNSNNYPSSMKNMPEKSREKAITIANALLDEGYTMNRAIPIAISQAEKWYENHIEKARRTSILSSDTEVRYDDTGWSVKSTGAKKASNTYNNKEQAIKRAREIAKNKDSNVRIYKKDGQLQQTVKL